MVYNIKNGSKIIVNGDKIEIDGKSKKQAIGINFANGLLIGGCLSSFDREFTDEEIVISSGIGDIVTTKIGDVKEALLLLHSKIKDDSSIIDIGSVIIDIVNDYFGGFENISSRMEYYHSSDYVESAENKITNLKNSGAAMCVERAALAQNLLCSLGIRSIYKASGILNNGRKEGHSYNLVEFDNHYYIFDVSIPNLINEKISPLIAEVDKEIFDLLCCPLQGVGISITVSHYNPYRSQDVTITYDSGREKALEIPQIQFKKSL